MFLHMVATAAQLPLPTLPREDRHRLTLFFKCGEDLAKLAEELAVPSKSVPPTSMDPREPEGRNGTDTLTASPAHRVTPSSDPDHDEFTLQTWSTQPEIAAHIAHRRSEREHRARMNAIAKLEHVAEATTDLIEKRRTATAILRTLNRAPSSPRGGGGGARAAGGGGSVSTFATKPPRPQSLVARSPATASDLSLGDEELTDTEDVANSLTPSPCHPLTLSSPVPSIPAAFAHKEGDIEFPTTAVPDPLRQPEDVIALALHAIQNPDHPERNTGPFTLFNLAGHIDDRTPAAFAEFRGNYLKNMINDAWGFASHTQRWIKFRTDRAYAAIDLTLRNGATRVVHVRLRRETFGVLKDCWLLHHFNIAPEFVPSPYPDDPFHDTS
jgi:hypothetical protein